MSEKEQSIEYRTWNVEREEGSGKETGEGSLSRGRKKNWQHVIEPKGGENGLVNTGHHKIKRK